MAVRFTVSCPMKMWQRSQKKTEPQERQQAWTKQPTLDKKLIFAIGNAPTALVRLYELIEDGKLDPELIIGVPVGFVNVVQSKELIMQSGAPYIVARGRKGGSNIAACICNALFVHDRQSKGLKKNTCSREKEGQVSGDHYLLRSSFRSRHAGAKSSAGIEEQESRSVIVSALSSRISRLTARSCGLLFLVPDQSGRREQSEQGLFRRHLSGSYSHCRRCSALRFSGFSVSVHRVS